MKFHGQRWTSKKTNISAAWDSRNPNALEIEKCDNMNGQACISQQSGEKTHKMVLCRKPNTTDDNKKNFSFLTCEKTAKTTWDRSSKPAKRKTLFSYKWKVMEFGKEPLPPDDPIITNFLDVSLDLALQEKDMKKLFSDMGRPFKVKYKREKYKAFPIKQSH